MRCEDLTEDSIAVLYGEADAAAQQRVNEHLAACAICREELSALRGVRRRLSAWKLPATLRPKRPWRRAPLWSGWALPAAAALLVSAGATLALGRFELRYSGGEWNVRLGGAAPTDIEQLLAQQDQRHRRELEALRAEFGAAREAQFVPAAGASLGSETLPLERVQALIAASEQRQRNALRAGLDLLEQRRQYDMARVRTGFSYLDGRNGQDMANAMRVVSYVLASQPGGGGDADTLRPR